MTEFLEMAIGFPTVIWTVLLGCVFMFWIVILSSGLSHDTFDIHHEVEVEVDVPSDIGGDVADVHVDAHDVHVDGHDVHVDAHDVHADAHGGAEGAAHAHHVATSDIFTTLLGYLNVGQVPITIIVSLLILEGWLLSMLGNISVVPLVGNMMHWAIWGSLMFLVTFMLAFFLAGLTTRPLRGVFKIHTFHAQEQIIDQVCIVRTTKVTATMGQAEFMTGGAPLILSVRCSQENSLSRGDKAVIISFDQEKDMYEVAPLDPKRK